MNENNHYRGIHIVLINPENGRVESAKVFDTYKSSKIFDQFIEDGIPDCYIVIAACKDEGTKSLSTKAIEWF